MSNMNYHREVAKELEIGRRVDAEIERRRVADLLDQIPDLVRRVEKLERQLPITVSLTEIWKAQQKVPAIQEQAKI